MTPMSRRWKLLLAGAVAAVLAVAIGASGAVAVSRALDSDDSRAVIEDAAAQLGIDPDDLSDALEDALENQLDEAVREGRLSDELAERLKERIESGELPFLGGLGFLHDRFGPGIGPGLGIASLDAASSYLGLSEDEVRDRLDDGDTLAEIARDEGKSVDGLVDALVAAANERFDEAVDEGHLDEDRAAELKEGVEERVRDLVNGELRFRRVGPRFEDGFPFRDGFQFPRFGDEFEFRAGPRA
jgi:lipoate-protein ligase A